MSLVAVSLFQYISFGIIDFLLFSQAVEQQVSRKRFLACGAGFVLAHALVLMLKFISYPIFVVLPLVLASSIFLGIGLRLDLKYAITRFLIAYAYQTVVFFFVMFIASIGWSDLINFDRGLFKLMTVMAGLVPLIILVASKHMMRYRFVKNPSINAWVWPSIIIFISSLFANYDEKKTWFWVITIFITLLFIIVAALDLNRRLPKIQLTYEVKRALQEPEPERQAGCFPAGVLDTLETARQEQWTPAETMQKLSDDLVYIETAVKEEGFPELPPLPKTGVGLLDQQLRRWAKKLQPLRIELDMRVFRPIGSGSMCGNLTEKELVTLVETLIQSAVEAIEASDNPYRCVTVRMGVLGDQEGSWYEIDVFDSGRRREPEQCWKELAAAVGYMKQARGSLLVGSRPPEPLVDTTKLAVRFDGRNEFTVQELFPNPM